MAVFVQQDDFSIDAEMKKLMAGRKNTGAAVSFTGFVRDDNDITEMTLEHYPGMTEKQLEKITDEAMKRFKLDDCLVIHRYGTLKVGAQIVLVIALSKSRHAAFEGASFLMDWLKTEAPFWKKETGSHGSNWVEAKEDDNQAQEKWN